MRSEDATVPRPILAPGFPLPPRALPAGDVHVWLADLDRPPAAVADTPVDALLDDEERARLGRFLSARDRNRFRISRTLLRTILGGYLDEAPPTLRLGAGAEGKPHLVDRGGRPCCELRFNLSHTGAVWVLAVRRDAEVGVDVERTTRRADVEGVSRRMFAGGERAAVARMPTADAEAAFFRIWSAREAVVKCLGVGMFSLDLDFEVAAEPGRPLALQPADRRTADALPAWIAEIPLPEGHVGVLTTRIPPIRVKAWALGAASTRS